MTRVLEGAVVLLAAGLALTPEAEAQGRWMGPEPFAVEWRFLGSHGSQARYEIRFRNNAGWTPDGAWRLTGIYIGADFEGCQRVIAPVCDVSAGPSVLRADGPVDFSHRPQFGQRQPSISGWNLNSTGFGGRMFGPLGAEFIEPETLTQYSGLGVYGCALPNILALEAQGNSASGHNGMTCAAAGFTGWIAMEVSFPLAFDYAGPQPDASHLFAIPFGGFDTRLPITAVPEPACLSLLGAGLFGLAAIARRRRGRAH